MPEQGEILLSLQAFVLRSLLAAIFKFLPYRIWRPLIVSALQLSVPVKADNARAVRVLSSVHWTDRFGPGRCLERTTTAWLLMRRNVACRIRIGVALKAPGDPFAHASLEVDGRIVFGEPNQTEFAMLDLESAPSLTIKPK